MGKQDQQELPFLNPAPQKLTIAEDQNNSLLLFCSPEYSYRQT